MELAFLFKWPFVYECIFQVLEQNKKGILSCEGLEEILIYVKGAFLWENGERKNIGEKNTNTDWEKALKKAKKMQRGRKI